MSIMLAFCQPLDITSPVGNSSACEWYCRVRGASALCDHPPVVGLYDQHGSPADEPPDRTTLPSGSSTVLAVPWDVVCVSPGATVKLMAGCHSRDSLDRLIIWNVLLLFRLPPPMTITCANG